MTTVNYNKHRVHTMATKTTHTTYVTHVGSQQKQQFVLTGVRTQSADTSFHAFDLETGRGELLMPMSGALLVEAYHNTDTVSEHVHSYMVGYDFSREAARNKSDPVMHDMVHGVEWTKTNTANGPFVRSLYAHKPHLSHLEIRFRYTGDDASHIVVHSIKDITNENDEYLAEQSEVVLSQIEDAYNDALDKLSAKQPQKLDFTPAAVTTVLV